MELFWKEFLEHGTVTLWGARDTLDSLGLAKIVWGHKLTFGLRTIALIPKQLSKLELVYQQWASTPSDSISQPQRQQLGVQQLMHDRKKTK